MMAAVALAACAHAAVAITWQTGTGVKDVDGNAFTTATTGYTATILYFTDSACTTPVSGLTGNTATAYKTKGSAGFGGVTSESFEAGNTYYSAAEAIADGGTADEAEWENYDEECMDDTLIPMGSGFLCSFASPNVQILFPTYTAE